MRAAPRKRCAKPDASRGGREDRRAERIDAREARSARETQGLAPAGEKSGPRVHAGGRAATRRTGADFIVQQISFHESTVAQFRAQLNGKGDADLKRELREALPGYQTESRAAAAPEALRTLSDGAAIREASGAADDGVIPASHGAKSDGAMACRYGNLHPMHRTDLAPFHARFPQGAAHTWLARRWYYTPRIASRVQRAADLARAIAACWRSSRWRSTRHTADRELACMQELSDMLFDRVIAGGADNAVGFAALENTAGGDRVIGVAAYAPDERSERQLQSRGGAARIAKNRWAASCCRRWCAMRNASACRASWARCTGPTGRCRCSPCRWVSRSSRWPRDRNLRRLVLTLK